MVEGRIAGLCAANALGISVDMNKLDEYEARLSALRAGEVGAKIREGIERVFCNTWNTNL
jgi:sarcosine oxidase subunit alpha